MHANAYNQRRHCGYCLQGSNRQKPNAVVGTAYHENRMFKPMVSQMNVLRNSHPALDAMHTVLVLLDVKPSHFWMANQKAVNRSKSKTISTPSVGRGMRHGKPSPAVLRHVQWMVCGIAIWGSKPRSSHQPKHGPASHNVRRGGPSRLVGRPLL